MEREKEKMNKISVEIQKKTLEVGLALSLGSIMRIISSNKLMKSKESRTRNLQGLRRNSKILRVSMPHQ